MTRRRPVTTAETPRNSGSGLTRRWEPSAGSRCATLTLSKDAQGAFGRKAAVSVAVARVRGVCVRTRSGGERRAFAGVRRWSSRSPLWTRAHRGRMSLAPALLPAHGARLRRLTPPPPSPPASSNGWCSAAPASRHRPGSSPSSSLAPRPTPAPIRAAPRSPAPPAFAPRNRRVFAAGGLGAHPRHWRRAHGVTIAGPRRICKDRPPGCATSAMFRVSEASNGRSLSAKSECPSLCPLPQIVPQEPATIGYSWR